MSAAVAPPQEAKANAVLNLLMFVKNNRDRVLVDDTRWSRSGGGEDGNGQSLTFPWPQQMADVSPPSIIGERTDAVAK